MIEQSIMVKNYQTTGSQRILRILLSQYEPLINKTTHEVKRKYTDIPLDFEDLKNVTKREFEKLILKFDETKGMRIPSFLKSYLAFGLQNYVKKFTNNSHKTMNFRDDLNEKEMPSILNDSNENEEQVEVIISKSNLTKLEESIIRNYWLEQKSVSEISEIVNLSERKVYYYNKKAHNKMSKIYTYNNI